MENNFPLLEKRILKFWKDNKTFEKSILRRKKASSFVFYEGPPTANGKPGIHHVLSRSFKDIICRYKTMQGFEVLRKAGWDTHGLPVELEIEKKLGMKNKKDIENYGIAKFNKKCRESVWEYKKEWENLTERIGFWLDMENPYITYEAKYIETVWRIMKEIYKKGFLYQDYKVVPYCPRCGTSLASHEVAQGYQKIKEPAIFVKFRIKNPEFKNSHLLIWTTTPWTLPGNVAAAFNPKFTYVEVKVDNDFFVLAKERMESCGIQGQITRELNEKDLIDLRYEPPYVLDEDALKNAYRVIPADFVSLEEGTGFVHLAPAFGEEDMEAIKKQNAKIKNQNEKFPILLTVNEEGNFILDVKKWAGLFVKDADPLIIEDLKSRSLLFKEELYEHDYPFCWRCKSPLLYYAKQSWFINMQEVKKNLISNNQKINWTPAYLKNGRFGEWLQDIKDWAVSRERYWGTPLPVWKCKTCGNQEVIGSKDDLLSQKFSQNRYFILRHGESLKNKKHINSCWPELMSYPLTKLGEEQIKKAAKKIKNQKIDLIFSSDLLRTKQSAEIVGSGLSLKVKFDKRLREIDIGILNGKPFEETHKFYDKEKKLSKIEYTLKRFQVSAPGGENYFDAEKRLHSFMKEMEKKYQGKTILIVSHQRPITLIEKMMQGYDASEFTDIVVNKKEIKTGEVRELEFKGLPYNEDLELDFHRPYADEVKFYCPKCQGVMERTIEVIDCWFDSGSMPFAQGHWPFEQKQKPKSPLFTHSKSQNLTPPELFPADYISEAIDQTRGWFYTLLAISTLLGLSSPYKNVISLGHVLDEKGEKMSKSKGNIIDPWYIVDKYGADAVRWYFYTVNQPGDSKMFSEKDIEDTLKKFILTLWNSLIFFETYKQGNSKFQNANSKNILDKWIISRLNNLIKETTENLNDYNVTIAARAIEKFVTDDLSQWYIRRSRKRFQKPKTEKNLREVSNVLGFVIFTLNKIIAPFIPFLSEEIYKQISGDKKQSANSVHLEDWPKADKKSIDKKLEEKMGKIREIIALSLAERAKSSIKVRQPLSSLKIKDEKLKSKIGKELLDLIKEEVNVKEVVFDGKIKTMVGLDTEITPELKEEGIIREIIRNIQEMRKKANLKPKDKIQVWFSGVNALNEIILKNKEFILEEARVKDLDLIPGEKGGRVYDAENEIKIDQQNLWLAIKKN